MFSPDHGDFHRGKSFLYTECFLSQQIVNHHGCSSRMWPLHTNGLGVEYSLYGQTESSLITQSSGDMKIKDFLEIKGHTVITIGPNETVHVALQRLVENNIGALPVCDEDGVLLGIISERDLLKEYLRHTSAISSRRVQEVMTQDVAVGNPEDDLNYAASLMKRKRVRHLPIVVGQKLQSIISMRDIVDLQLKDAQVELSYVGLIKRHHHFGRTHLL